MSQFAEPFEYWDLTPVVNASGTMTSLGASRVSPRTADAVKGILPHFVIMDELQDRASRVITAVTGAEAGCVTGCSAAAMTLACAAAITGDDLEAIEKLPDCGQRERRVAVQAGHLINYGAPVAQGIRLCGAEVVSLGSAALCERYHLAAAVEAGLAAALFVVSHHTVREGQLPRDLFIEVCHSAGVPVIVDMASEYDLRGPVSAGADLVIYSGHKFLGGPTSGIVAGREALVRALYLQHRGIGRSMKVGKEGVVGAMTALELWSTRDHDALAEEENQRLRLWENALKDLPGLGLSRHPDWTGNPITRLQVTVIPREARLYAWELASRLAKRRPAIRVRDDLVEQGQFYLDPCNLDLEEARLVATAMVEECESARKQGDGLRQTWSDVKRERFSAGDKPHYGPVDA